jgi:Cu/Zn superoxide dismutase
LGTAVATTVQDQLPSDGATCVLKSTGIDAPPLGVASMGNYPGSTTLPAPTGEVHLSETVHMAANTFTCTPSPTSTNTFTCGAESVDAAKTKVSISQVSKTTVRLTYAIQGVGIADGRYGVHIHTGTTCASAAAAGGHMWAPSSAPDPWALSSSTYTMVNNVAVGSFDLDMGYSLMSVEGRVVVIYASNGDKIACSPLVKETAIALEYDMNHLGANSAGGIHIHAGTECVSAGPTVPAGHYYDTAVYPDAALEPWKMTTWASDFGGRASGTVVTNSGYGLYENIQHVVVMHDHAGNRVSNTTTTINTTATTALQLADTTTCYNCNCNFCIAID